MSNNLNTPIDTDGNAITDATELGDIDMSSTNMGDMRAYFVEYIESPETTSTTAYTGVSKDSALRDGKLILYRNQTQANGNWTLNLTLSDGTTTGAKPVYSFGTANVGTMYKANSVIPMVYRTAANAWYASAGLTPADLSGKVDKANPAIAGNLAALVAGGGIQDSGKKAGDFASVADATLTERYAEWNVSGYEEEEHLRGHVVLNLVDGAWVPMEVETLAMSAGDEDSLSITWGAGEWGAAGYDVESQPLVATRASSDAPWTVSPSVTSQDEPIFISTAFGGSGAWVPAVARPCGDSKGDTGSASLLWHGSDYAEQHGDPDLAEWGGGHDLVATRTALSGYQLGSQSGKPLASEAEAEALRTGKADTSALAPLWVASETYDAGNTRSYNGKVYECILAVNPASATTPDNDTTHWKVTDMTSPDATLDITADARLRVMSAERQELWSQGYALAGASSVALSCDKVNYYAFASGTVTQAFAMPRAAAGKVGDFVLDIDNSANASADATATLTGWNTAFDVYTTEGEVLSDLLTFAGGEKCELYFSLTAFGTAAKPAWKISKVVVEKQEAGA